MSCASSIYGGTGLRTSLETVQDQPLTKVACTLMSIAGSIFGRLAVATCFASLGPLVWIPVLLLSGVGGTMSGYSGAALLLGAEGSLPLACLVVAVAVIGAVGGFFLGGGPITAIGGAFFLIGAVSFVVGAIQKICF